MIVRKLPTKDGPLRNQRSPSRQDGYSPANCKGRTMARNGSGVYSLPAGSTATDGNTAEGIAAQHPRCLILRTTSMWPGPSLQAGPVRQRPAPQGRALDSGQSPRRRANLVDIGGGEIDGTPIGANSAIKPAHSPTLSASGDVALDNKHAVCRCIRKQGRLGHHLTR